MSHYMYQYTNFLINLHSKITFGYDLDAKLLFVVSLKYPTRVNTTKWMSILSLLNKLSTQNYVIYSETSEFIILLGDRDTN